MSEYGTRPFYNEAARTNLDTCMAGAKLLDSVGIPLRHLAINFDLKVGESLGGRLPEAKFSRRNITTLLERQVTAPEACWTTQTVDQNL